MNEYQMNRIANANNEFQGKHKRVLAVCSAGLLRSPTTAVVLSQAPYNYNTRAAGLEKEFALIPVDNVLLHWADEIVCMTAEQGHRLRGMTQKLGLEPTIIVLNIEDNFAYRNPELMKLIATNYDAALVELLTAEKEADETK